MYIEHEINIHIQSWILFCVGIAHIVQRINKIDIIEHCIHSLSINPFIIYTEDWLCIHSHPEELKIQIPQLCDKTGDKQSISKAYVYGIAGKSLTTKLCNFAEVFRLTFARKE